MRFFTGTSIYHKIDKKMNKKRKNIHSCKNRHTFFDRAVKAASARRIRIVQGKADLTSFAGLALIVNILASTTALDKLDTLLPPPNGHARNWIPYSSVAKIMVAMLCLGCRHFEHARRFHQDTLMRRLAGTTVSPETLRQKMDFLAAIPEAARIVEEAAIQLAARAAMQEAGCGSLRLIPLDIDPTPLDNSGSAKEKTGPTYDEGWGYCPMTSFLGTVPFFSELRPGPQHSINGTPEFMDRCLAGTDALCIPRDRILVRGDSGVDGAELFARLLKASVYFIVKRNPRKSKNKSLKGTALLALARERGVEPECDRHRRGRRYYRFVISGSPKGLKGRGISCIAEVRVDEYDDKGRRYISEELGTTAATWWTNLPDPDPRTIVMLYHDHATMEQHHGELKTDMGIERLPSGKFETNRLYLQLSYIAFAALRLIGDRAVECDPGVRPRRSRPAPKRLRIGTILARYVLVPCRLVWHSRRFSVVLGDNYPHFEVFREIHAQC